MGSESKRDRAAFSALYLLCLAEKLLQPPVEWDRGRGREGKGEGGDAVLIFILQKEIVK